MKLIIPMSGEGRRFRDAGFAELKPFIEVEGKAILEHLLLQFPSDWETTFICSQSHMEAYSLRSRLEKIRPGCKIIAIPDHRQGPGGAILSALQAGWAVDDEPCVVSYCDYSMEFDARAFEAYVRATDCDGAVICYTGFHPEYIRPTMYAYCRTDGDQVLDIKEKGSFTENRENEYASCGAYYFKSSKLLIESLQEQLSQSLLINGELYLSLTYKPILNSGLNVRIFEIPYFLQWGTPDDLKDYLYWSKGIRAFLSSTPPTRVSPLGSQLLMPMAGRGERFGEGLPKPLRPVADQPMFLLAKTHFPRGESETYVVRDSFEQQVRTLVPNANVVSLSGVTEGQAITTQIGARGLDPSRPVLVTACDHGLIWDESAWNARLDSQPDVLVFGQRGYPGSSVTPNAFAYIRTLGAHQIQAVSVKQPISNDPRQDHLLVGSFYFKSVSLMNSLIDQLVSQNLRVNGEFYLDSVIDLAVQRGLDCQVFETDGYLCWGTPDALKSFDYWHSYFVYKAGHGENI